MMFDLLVSPITSVACLIAHGPQAVVQANKEGPAAKKVAYYSFILANQLSAEDRIKVSKLSGKADMSSQIQLSVALQKMKDAFEGSKRLPVRVLSSSFESS
jgi:hypothetical protein